MEEYWAKDIDEALKILEEENSETVDSNISYQINFWKVREMAFLRAAKQYLEHKTETTAANSEPADEDFGTDPEE
jgi:hypothetical protein